MSILGRRLTSNFGGLGRALGPFNFDFATDLVFQLQLAGPGPQSFDLPQDFQECQAANSGIRLVVVVVDALGNPVNIRNNQGLLVKLLRPDGSSVDLPGTLLTNGSDGALYYSTFKTDLTQAGLWRIQAEVVLQNAPLSTRLGQFQVDDNVDDN